jgi:hypothetical protein
MNGQRQKIQNEQLALAFMTEGGGEARRAVHEGFEPSVASHDLESPARDDGLMEQICARDNVSEAWQRVRANGGTALALMVEVSTTRPSTCKSIGRVFETKCSTARTSRNR